MCSQQVRTILAVSLIAYAASPTVKAQGTTPATGIAHDLPPVIGKMSPDLAARKLEEIGELQAARDARIAASRARPGSPFSVLTFNGHGPAAWQHTGFALGYIAGLVPGATSPLDIKNAAVVSADTSLRNARIRITLDRLRVWDYPGRGEHNILFDFQARNKVGPPDQDPEQYEDLHFNQSFRIREGESAGVVNYPIFVGLTVGRDGVSFKGYTVNVSNADDDKIMNFLNSEVFKQGLQLLNTLNPVVPIVTNYAKGVTEAIASRNKNVPVQDFFLGLDFGGPSTGARLATGSYVVVQIPEDRPWDWSNWIYNPTNGAITSRTDPGASFDYNYLVLGISRY